MKYYIDINNYYWIKGGDYRSIQVWNLCTLAKHFVGGLLKSI